MTLLHKSLDVVDIPNIKLLKKNTKKFHKNLRKLFCEKDNLIAKLNESNKLVDKYKKLSENSLEKLKEFECLNIDLDAKLVLSKKLIDELKCKNESLSMHAKCLTAEPITKNDENILLQSCYGIRFCVYCVFYLKGQIGVHSST